MVATLVILLMPLILLTAVIIYLVGAGKLPASSGRLTNTRFMHYVGLIYPLVLLLALALYYLLPFDQLLRLPPAAYDDPELASDQLMIDLAQTDGAILQDGSLPITSQTLAINADRLALDSSLSSVAIWLSREPAPAGEVSLTYYAGSLAASGCDLTPLLTLQAPSFTLQDAVLKMNEPARDEPPIRLSLTAWSTPMLLRQFDLDNAQFTQHRITRSAAVLVLAVPADVTVVSTSDGNTAVKGSFCYV